FYSGGAYQRADSLFHLYTTAFPDSVYGYFWSARANLALDTTMSIEPYASNMVKGYQKSLDIALLNPRFKAQGIVASQYLAGYFNNIKKDKEAAISYLKKGLQLDPTNAPILELLNILQKPPAKQTTTPKTPAKNSGKKEGTKPVAKKKAVNINNIKV
ncbi:MAG: hypothetical protein M3O67_04120, partial [Bacteroidota bacterium]|nr:hypothetical protein [Bacteroidota bacterium]